MVTLEGIQRPGCTPAPNCQWDLEVAASDVAPQAVVSTCIA